MSCNVVERGGGGGGGGGMPVAGLESREDLGLQILGHPTCVQRAEKHEADELSASDGLEHVCAGLASVQVAAVRPLGAKKYRSVGNRRGKQRPHHQVPHSVVELKVVHA